MRLLLGLVAVLIGTLAAAILGVAAGVAIGALLLIAPLVFLWRAIRPPRPESTPS